MYGGDGSNGTFDCSGYTMYVYKHFGINIPHGANSQYRCGKGKKITKYSELQVGDIVFLTDYETGKGIGHCGIYLGMIILFMHQQHVMRLKYQVLKRFIKEDFIQH